jgi:pimeloyl-ACP methyl ester carboxylesterase
MRQVGELHALLAGAGIDAPYVLVGHSYGGRIARV